MRTRRAIIFALLTAAVLGRTCARVHADGDTVPFRLRLAGQKEQAGKLMLKFEARYDVERVLGALCVQVEAGDQIDSSCWEADGLGAPLRSVTIRTGAHGEGAARLVQVSGNGHRQSNVEQFLLP